MGVSGFSKLIKSVKILKNGVCATSFLGLVVFLSRECGKFEELKTEISDLDNKSQ